MTVSVNSMGIDYMNMHTDKGVHYNKWGSEMCLIT